MPQKYYNSAETAKLLGKSVDEIKKMLERRELHGYRDGADWKFKVEDIDALAKQHPPKPSDEAGGDVLLSEVELGQSDPGLSLETPLNLGPVAEESLELGEDDMLATSETADEGAATQLKTDDDFLLTPLEETAGAEESESGSQVIALDTEGDEGATMVGAAAGVSMAAMLDEDLSAQPALEMGMAGPLAGAPVLGGQPGALAEGTALMQPAAALLEPPYSGWQIAGLAICAFLLMLCGMMVYDLVRSMWSEQSPGPYSINSWLMDTILGWIEGR